MPFTGQAVPGGTVPSLVSRGNGEWNQYNTIVSEPGGAALRVTLKTGGDNLRGGNDNLDIGVIVDGQVKYWFRNVNRSQEWKNNTSHTVTLRENSAFWARDVEGITLRTSFGGGISGDNWNLDRVGVTLSDRGTSTSIYNSPSGRVHRFTGDHPRHTIYWGGNFLQVTLRTGGDNLRGGNDNLDIGVIVDGQVKYWFRNVNRKQEWKNHTNHTVQLRANSAFNVQDVDGLTLRTSFGGGISGDNWNLDKVSVTRFSRGVSTSIYTSLPGLVHRFTGELPEHTLYWKGNFLQVTIWTGSDDLRGGGDNANLSIIYTDGHRQRFRNVNKNGTWQDNLAQTVYLPLPTGYRSLSNLDAIGGLFLETTVSGGVSGDNWNVNRIRIIGHVGHSRKTLYDQRGNPLIRITGDRRQHLFNWKSIAPSGRVMTSFNAENDGFNFSNAFKESYAQSIVQNKGLCGGMSYTALDYHYAGRSIPSQNFRPAPGLALREYIYQRQVASLTGGSLDQWVELFVNPGGSRNNEFYRWGLQFGSGRLGELIDNIDAGRPVPLGVRSCSGCSRDHQIVAYGYELGAYYGSLDNTVEDIKIYVYDPNHPDKELVLSPSPNERLWRTYTADGKRTGSRWRTYFVDEDYFGSRRTPPSVPSYGDIILLELETGQDDLRRNDLGHGGSTFDVVLRTHSGKEHLFKNAYGNRPEMELLSKSVEFVPLDISRLDNDFKTALASVEIVTSFAGGLAGDNWDLNRLGVRSQIGTRDCILLRHQDTTPVRFTGQTRSKRYALSLPTSCQDRTAPRRAPGLQLRSPNDLPDKEDSHAPIDQEAATSGESEASITKAVPESFALEQNYPNPFNPSTAIHFALPELSRVRLTIYDMLGREVQRLVDGELGAGIHEVQFNATGLPSGTYLYRLETPQGSFSKRMVLLK